MFLNSTNSQLDIILENYIILKLQNEKQIIQEKILKSLLEKIETVERHKTTPA